ncbi:MAG TPA: hypothetical protein VGM43_07030 [Bryobacteraceae bacterium]
MRKLVPALLGCVFVYALMAAEKPSSADAAALIEKGRQKSLAYARSLPDFVCTETISRYKLGAPGRAAPRDPPDWVLVDKLAVNVSYFQQHETHELKLLNGKPTHRSFDSLSVTSTGEFGGILKSIFDPASRTSFRWESWTNVRGRPAAAYSYNVKKIHSHYYVDSGEGENAHRATVGFHGTVKMDRETGEVLYLNHIADRIPSELQITGVVTEIDYDFSEVSGNRYLLPAHSQTNIDSNANSWKNESAFQDYRKFDVSSKMDFGADK